MGCSDWGTMSELDVLTAAESLGHDVSMLGSDEVTETSQGLALCPRDMAFHPGWSARISSLLLPDRPKGMVFVAYLSSMADDVNAPCLGRW